MATGSKQKLPGMSSCGAGLKLQVSGTGGSRAMYQFRQGLGHFEIAVDAVFRHQENSEEQDANWANSKGWFGCFLCSA